MPRDLLALELLFCATSAIAGPEPASPARLSATNLPLHSRKAREPVPALPLQVHNHQLKMNDLDVRVLRSQFGNLPPEPNELEFRAQTLKVYCVFHPVSLVMLSFATTNSRKRASE
jgi:hypothetical protein